MPRPKQKRKKVAKKKVTRKVAKKNVSSKETKPVARKKVVKRKTKKLTVSKIVCSRCKTEKKTNRQQMDKLVSKFGSLQDVHDKYHCIACRKKYNVRKDGKPLPQKKSRKEKPVITEETVKRISRPIEHCECIKRPKGLSKKKWETALRETVEWGIKKGILLPVKVDKPLEVC